MLIHGSAYTKSAPIHTSWLDPAWLYYSQSTSVVAPGVLVCVNNRWRGNASRPPIDQILRVCVCWAAQPLDSCSGVADNIAHNPVAHNWPFNYSGGCGKCNAYSTLYLCLSLCSCFSCSLRLIFFCPVSFALCFVISQFSVQFLISTAIYQKYCQCTVQNACSKKNNSSFYCIFIIHYWDNKFSLFRKYLLCDSRHLCLSASVKCSICTLIDLNLTKPGFFSAQKNNLELLLEQQILKPKLQFVGSWPRLLRVNPIYELVVKCN